MIKPSESSGRLYKMINSAIEDGRITREEYDMILYIAAEDGIHDFHEKILLEQLQEMIHSGTVKMVAR
ncbi:MAG: hypothetical protein PVF73_10685 [Bacteroidales bacterium]|jgi:hypothetical protein